MPDPEITTGTTEEATGTTAETAADGSADAAGGSESIETVRARLEEAERKNAQLLSEKSNVEERARQVEQAREDLQRRGASPPPTATDPDMVELAELNQIVADCGAQSTEGRLAVITANRILENRRLRGAFAFKEKIEEDLDDVPEEHRAAVRKEIRAGRHQSVPSALAAVKGTTSEARIAALEAEVKRLQAGGEPAAAPPARPNVQTSVRSQIDAETTKKAPTAEDIDRTLAAGGPKATELRKAIDEGRIHDPRFA